MPSPWVVRAQNNMLPAVDKSGHIYRVEESEARAAAEITAAQTATVMPLAWGDPYADNISDGERIRRRAHQAWLDEVGVHP